MAENATELHVYRNEVIDWVIASSPEDAARVWEEHTSGAPYPEEYGTWRQLPDSDVLPMNDEVEGHREMTCAKWASLNGRSFLGSTEY